jgi:NADH:ubiquinone oxidoreductase subunit C
MSEASPQLQYIQAQLGAKVLGVAQPQGDDSILLERGGLRDSFRLLKEDGELSFDLLSDITAVDYWKVKEPRFEVVYQLTSLKRRRPAARPRGAAVCACAWPCRRTTPRWSR